MKILAALTALAALAFLACGGGEGPVGVRGVTYWDLSFGTPDALITDVDMVSGDSGWACGYRYNAPTDTYDGLVYHYNGTTWSVAFFLPGEAGARFKDIDFLADNDGWVVGMRGGGGGEHPGRAGDTPVLFHYDGTVWMEMPFAEYAGGEVKFLSAFSPADVWICDGKTAYHFDGGMWTPFEITTTGDVDGWCFPAPEVGWAVDYDNGYCYRWDAATMAWTLEPYPLYNITSFYFLPDGSGYYADYENVPPIGAHADIYKRVPGDVISYERVHTTTTGKWLTACAYFPPSYFFFAGPNAAYEVDTRGVEPLGDLPPSGFGQVRALSLAALGNPWGVQSQSNQVGPSFIVHKSQGR